MKRQINESRVVRKYICECGTCGGKGEYELDDRTFTCENCKGSGVTIRANKLRTVQSMVKRRTNEKERTYYA